MAEQIFEIEAIKRRALDCLRGADGALSTGMVACRLGLPLWAVDAALEEAFRSGEAEFTAGQGWRVVQAVPVPPVAQPLSLHVFGREGDE